MTTTKSKSREATKTTKPADSLGGVRRHDAAVAGDAAHQGDLIFVVLDKLPTGAKVRKNRQLAEGDTQGSRHVLVSGEVYDCDPAAVAKAIEKITGKVVEVEFVGPVFKGGVVEHPQHEHHAYPDDCTVAVLYQRNVDAERRIQRARD